MDEMKKLVIGNGEFEIVDETARTNAVITPEMYGAIGDGVTDDTVAIQACINANPNSTIVFKNKKYRITDTINLYGNTGGAHIIFGGATIIWDGVTNGIMFDVTASTGDDGRPQLTGGNFDGNEKAATAIRLNKYHCILENAKIYDCIGEMLVIGTANGGRSLQCSVSNVIIYVSRSSSSLDWTDSNTIIGLSVYEADNFFSEVNINRCNKSVYYRASGCEFINCHFTAEYRTAKESTEDIPDSFAVYYEPYSTTSIGSENFTNCYFDNHKYCLYAASENRNVFSLTNCKYFNSGKQTTKVGVAAFLLGGYSTNVQVENFTVIPSGGKCIFYDATFNGTTADASGSAMSLQMVGIIKQTFAQSIYSLDADAFVAYTAAHLRNNNEFAEVYRYATISAGYNLLLGSFVVRTPYANLDRMPSILLHFRNRSYLHADITLGYDKTNHVLQVLKKEVLTADTSSQYKISEPYTITINGVAHQVFDLYMSSINSGSLSGKGYLFLSAETNSPTRVYLINEQAVNVQDSDITVGTTFDFTSTT
jgi:hypothetical protein